jgi:hypothetical protein
VPLSATVPVSALANGLVLSQASGATAIRSREHGGGAESPKLDLCYVIAE